MDEFEIPADLSLMSDDDLNGLHDQAVAAFDAVYESEDRSALSDLAAAIQSLRTERDGRIERAAAETEAAEAMRASIHGGDDDPDAPAEGDEPAEAEGDDEAEGADAEPVLVTAAATPRRFAIPAARVREAAPEIEVDEGGDSVVITAAANVPGVPAGGRIDLDAVAVAMHGVARTLPISHGNGQHAPVASIELPHDPRFAVGEGSSETQIMEAVREASNPDVLVASGGWCTPSTPLFDLFSIEEADGLLDLPTVTGGDRGGVIFPESPSIADVFASPDGPWLWTEAMDIAAETGTPTKPCFKIPCPGFDEVRNSCHGLCITHGNLSDTAYPELTRRWLDLFMAAHMHLQSQRRLATIITGSTAVATTDFGGMAAPTLSAIDLAVADYRDLFRMGENAVLEVLFARHTRGQIRADLAFRQGVDLMSVTNAQIDAYLRDRGVVAQFLSDFDPLGGAVAATAWPTTKRFIIYAAGTWAQTRSKTIDLGVVRDSTLNETNDFTAAWSEECYSVFKPGHLSRIYTVDVCTNGSTNPGDAAEYVCA